ncbi:MAG: hypothetical protein JRH19_12600 [Deltaproteobacteria bacterium]|nr:hypothetical protein [Deltaproteobacteria bacterium]
MDFSSAIESILSELKKVASSEAIVGKPIKTDQATVIPVSRLRLGFGVGVGDAQSGADRGAGTMGTGAGGGGVSVDPQAFVVINADGRAHMISLKDTKDASLIQAISILPDVMEKVIRTGGEVFGAKGSGAERSEPDPDESSGGKDPKA